jgi:hypothetical protein
MGFSLSHVLILVGVTAAVRLATLYLRRLDREEADAPEAKRKAIAASRRRAQGHLWFLGALMALLIAMVLLVGANRPSFGLGIALLTLGLLVAAGLCAARMVRAYRDARRIRTAT